MRLATDWICKVISRLRDWRLFLRFSLVNGIGTVVDYLAAVALVAAAGLGPIVATTIGFVLGTMVNYVGHTVFSYGVGRSSLSIANYLRYLIAVLLSLAVRLAAVTGLERATSLPFWIILIVAIGASFLASYVLATLWVFRRSGR